MSQMTAFLFCCFILRVSNQEVDSQSEAMSAVRTQVSCLLSVVACFLFPDSARTCATWRWISPTRCSFTTSTTWTPFPSVCAAWPSVCPRFVILSCPTAKSFNRTLNAPNATRDSSSFSKVAALAGITWRFCRRFSRVDPKHCLRFGV